MKNYNYVIIVLLTAALPLTVSGNAFWSPALYQVNNTDNQTEASNKQQTPVLEDIKTYNSQYQIPADYEITTNNKGKPVVANTTDALLSVKNNKINSLIIKNTLIKNSAKIDILKRDRQISKLLIINNDLKAKILDIRKYNTQLATQINKISSVALRKDYISKDKLAMQQDINNLSSIVKKLRIDDNIRCHKFKKIVQEQDIPTTINCKSI